MTDYIELIVRWIFALQMIFWGLNGFFNWITITPPSATLEKFVLACIETRFIMPTVKVVEIVFGAFLISGFIVPVSILMFAPIIFVITGLHVLHNPRPWGVLVTTTLPFTLLMVLHSEDLLRLVY
jgi:uncharacterized membrane protein YphA (DoxX/SURF4 family)